MKLYVAAILAIAFCESFNIHIMRGTFESQTMALSSCEDLRKIEINVKRISDYEIQNRPIKAVIFITRDGVKVCVPHNLPWVKRNINRLNKKKTRKQKRTAVSPTASSFATNQLISSSK